MSDMVEIKPGDNAIDILRDEILRVQDRYEQLEIHNIKLDGQIARLTAERDAWRTTGNSTYSTMNAKECAGYSPPRLGGVCHDLSRSTHPALKRRGIGRTT
jgi:hypothetical protein